MTNARVTQATVETVSNVNPNVRVTQAPLETISTVAAHARVTQSVLEVISSSQLVPPGGGYVIQLACT